jgi:hypothetical protein
MPTVTAQSLVSRAKIVLQDTTNVRWSDAELLSYLNDGQRAICIKRPDANATVGTIALVAGTKQSLPDAATSLIRAVRNMGVAGATAGRAIRHIPMTLLDATIPSWHTVAATQEVLHVTSDPRFPQTFYVYPPSTGTWYIEGVYAAPPTDVAALGNVIGIDDVFATPLVDYICFRADLKDQDLVGNAERAAMHLKIFESTMGDKAQADAQVAAGPMAVKG